MDELRELYQEVILDHNKNPQNYGQLPQPTHFSRGHNPLCGDKIEVYLQVRDQVIEDIAFQGAGCAISKASASLMTSVLKGKTVAEAEKLFAEFQGILTGKSNGHNGHDRLGPLVVLAGVREFPIRVKCATLAWHTLHAALQNSKNEQPVSTE